VNAIVDFPILSTLNSYDQLELDFDPELQTIFSWMAPKPRPCFTAKLLEEVRHFEKLLEANQGFFSYRGQSEKVDFLVAGSKAQGVYNLGGDLAMFVDAIMLKDREKLHYYAELCIDNIYRRYTGFGADIPTIALVQGKCFGGGFECALTSDVIVAERSATFSFPEVLFNLIPGMGGLTLLGRRIGIRKAEEILMSGRVFDAKEMHEMGVVDYLAEDGLGLATTRSLIQNRRKKLLAHRLMFRAKLIAQPLDKQELLDIVNLWVESALHLESRDLRMMARLMRSQDKLVLTPSDEPGIEVYFNNAAARSTGSD
jgi:DSF synthase